MNAVLQCLYATRGFPELVERASVLSRSGTNEVLLRRLQELFLGLQRGRRDLDPARFEDAFRRARSGFDSGFGYDADEFLGALFDYDGPNSRCVLSTIIYI